MSVYKRPGVEHFIASLSTLFELIVYTASTQNYANAIVDRLDPARHIQHRLYRDHCTFYGSFPIKNLALLGRDLKDVIIVDDMAVAYSKNPGNGVPVSPWKGEKGDRELQELLPVLELLAEVQDVRVHLAKLNRGGRIDFKSAVAVLKQEIAVRNSYSTARGKSPISVMKTERSLTEQPHKFNSQSHELKIIESLLPNSRWKLISTDKGFKHSTIPNTPLLKQYTSHGNLLNTPANITIKQKQVQRQPVTIMHKAYELAGSVGGKGYSSANPWAGAALNYGQDKMGKRGSAYGAYQVHRITYANF